MVVFAEFAMENARARQAHAANEIQF